MRAGSDSDGGGLAPDAVARVLDVVYDAVADAGRWRDVATLLPRVFDGNYGIVLLFDTVGGEVRFDHFCTPEGPIPPEWLRRYEEASLDPAARPMLVDMMAEAGRVQTFAEWSARSVASGRLPRWMEEARTFGIAHNAFFYLTDQATGSVVLFAVTRPPDRAPYAPAELARFGELIPHVRRAFRIARRMAEREAAGAAAIGPLDDLAVGVVLVDAGGHVLHADAEARAALDAAATPLAIATPSGEALRLPGLEHAIRAVAGDGAAAPVVLALPGRDGGKAIVIGAGSPAGHPGAPADDRAAAVVLLVDPARVRETSPERLGRLHGLNEREAAVLARLGDGAEVAQIADALGIARETVRRDLQRIRARTGTRRQDELVALARRPPP